MENLRFESPVLSLPKKTTSICPECLELIPAEILERDGKVVMEKTCPVHGRFFDIVQSDVKFYLNLGKWWFGGDGRGFSNPLVEIKEGKCPLDCGICPRHKSMTALANIDLTNRCNLKCPVCFANSAVSGYLFEPSFEEVLKMMEILRERKPIPVSCLQFSGGEPTLHPDFLKIIFSAKELGFSVIQVATNGIKFADLEFAQKAKEAGLYSLYLQFDGLRPETYLKTRGRDLLAKKLKAIENARKVGMKIVLVPTIVKGFNDEEVGNIVKFALKNVDVVSGISFQPIALTGRIPEKQRLEMRYTISDLARDIQEQTGLADPYKDWFPVCAEVPLSQFFSCLEQKEVISYSCHPNCGAATYLFVPDNKKAVAITQFLDLKGFLEDMEKIVGGVKSFSLKIRVICAAKALNALSFHFKKEKAPPGLTFLKFLETIFDLKSPKTDKKKDRGFKTLMVGGMHFMDNFNFDVERVQRCVIHYVAPDGRMYPFCAYNAGFTFREKIEKKYSRQI